jgi:hypothetical protein
MKEKGTEALRIEGVGSLPPMEFERRESGAVIFRYCAHEGDYASNLITAAAKG